MIARFIIRPTSVWGMLWNTAVGPGAFRLMREATSEVTDPGHD